MEESGEENSVLTVQFTEEAESDDCFQSASSALTFRQRARCNHVTAPTDLSVTAEDGAVPDRGAAFPVLSNANKVAGPHLMSSTHRSIKDIKLRKYQEELAQPAYNGKNTIICAPTGSGKTFVALSICDHHLKSMPQGQKGKIVFMATKVPVYEQQKSVFCEYFDNTGYTVVGVSGEDSENAPVGRIIEDSDIIILTPQILVNCLNDESVPSLSIFTLLIFDECHNTIGHHPYNVLMFHYLDLKLGCPDQKRPQIIGLTASVGTGKSRNRLETMNYITRLCACLDIEEISTVKENTEELERVVYKPQKDVRETTQRDNDPFAEVIKKIMAEIEQMAKSIFPHIDQTSAAQDMVDSLISAIIQTLELKEDEAASQDISVSFKRMKLPSRVFPNHKEFDNTTSRHWEHPGKCFPGRKRLDILYPFAADLVSKWSESPKKLNDSLIINDDARTKDALEYLQKFFTDIKNGTFTEIEQELAKKFEDELPLLQEISDDNENPKLEELQFILIESYQENPDTRTLLFVNTRALVVAIFWTKDSISSDPSLFGPLDDPLSPLYLRNRICRYQRFSSRSTAAVASPV
ncbi:unnamed protein product [Ranitomeya imitator]|uniref:Helicase ATP-binding domain-containing protein n=1 Tax=Ranitomeya imitator TaxID=111125 RepID=A0ABN9L8B6_9NEOB|nr:unnamed protein product [Ranitomeya imitator]